MQESQLCPHFSFPFEWSKIPEPNLDQWCHESNVINSELLLTKVSLHMENVVLLVLLIQEKNSPGIPRKTCCFPIVHHRRVTATQQKKSQNKQNWPGKKPTIVKSGNPNIPIQVLWYKPDTALVQFSLIEADGLWKGNSNKYWQTISVHWNFFLTRSQHQAQFQGEGPCCRVEHYTTHWYGHNKEKYQECEKSLESRFLGV